MIRPWLEATRPKTLPAAIIPVLVGSALAHAEGSFNWQPATACMVFALLIQIGTNFANDYADFEKGADSLERVGPRRAVASGLIPVAAMRRGAFIVFGLAFACGMALVHWRGWELLPLGIMCLLFGWAYTGGPFPLAYHGLGDVFVFVFFGLVAVSGTYYVLTDRLECDILLAAVPVGLLATNILVVNNYRDIVVDERAGKHTLVVRFGRKFARRQYALSLVCAAAVPIVLALKWERPPLAFASLAIVPGVLLTRQLATMRDGRGLNSLLGRTAALLLGFGATWAPLLAFA
ncbi:MAG: 1,4-dihydroxy-2-naphthoate polyprenyltransferase [Opitutaceae bacterium]